MNLLTIIGNAAVDPTFRKKLLSNPLETAQQYGFQLTKFEAYLLTSVFTNKSSDLARAFESLERALYANLPVDPKTQALILTCPRPPCYWSIVPPDSDEDDK